MVMGVCEKIPPVRKEWEVRDTKAKKRKNFDQQAGTRSQSLSQLYGNPPRPTYTDVSAARSKSAIFNPVGLLSQTSDDVSSQKTKKVSKRKKTRFEKSTQN